MKELQLASLQAQLQRDKQLFSEGLLSQELLKKSELAAAQAAIELKQTARRARQRAGSDARRVGRPGPGDRQAARRRSGSAAPARSRLAPRRSRRRADVGDHRRGHVGHEGRKRWRASPTLRRSAWTPTSRTSTPSGCRRAAGDGPHRRRTLDGTVAAINPTVANGVITVAIALAEPSSPLLRSNLRVDVEIVTARQAADAARAPRAVCHRRRHAAGVRRSRRARSSDSR